MYYTEDYILYNFFKDWLKWAEQAPVGDCVFPWDSRQGLCRCLEDWLITTNYNSETKKSTSNRLKMLFEEDGLDPIYPFGEESFHNGLFLGTQHYDKDRVDWVKEKVAQYEWG